MKMKFFMLMVLTVCFFMNPVFSSCWNECDDNKAYISAEQIMITQEGIFVIFEGEPIPVETIGQDANGLYCGFKSTWTCPKCDTVNEWWRMKCKRCKY